MTLPPLPPPDLGTVRIGRIDQDMGYSDDAMRAYAEQAVAAAAKQRVPLTDDQVFAALSDQVFWATSRNFILRVVRDVERAHGIVEAP